MKNSRCSTNSLVASKSQLFSSHASVSSLIIDGWSTNSRSLLFRNNNYLGIFGFVTNSSQKCREILQTDYNLMMEQSFMKNIHEELARNT